MEGLATFILRRLMTAQGGYDWVGVRSFVRVVDKILPQTKVLYKNCPS